MCVPDVEDSLCFSPELDLTHLDQPWLCSTSPRNVGAGSWAHSRQEPVTKAAPRDLWGLFTEWTHGAGWWDTG